MTDRTINSPGTTDYHYLRLLWRSRNVLIRNFIIIAVLSVGFSLILPKTFTSQAVLMPPKGENDFGLVNTLINSPFSALMGAGSSTEALELIAILKSRSLKSRVIDEFNLVEFYDAKDFDRAILDFESNYAVSVEEEGTVSVKFFVETGWFPDTQEESEYRELVAQITNYIIDVLDEMNQKMKIERARFQRLFIEDRYLENKQDLATAEEKMRSFQEASGVIALPEQTAAVITAAATLQAELLAKQVKLDVMEASLPADHPSILSLNREIAALHRKISEMETGETYSSVFPGIEQVPELFIDYSRLFREIEIQNTLFKFLTQQYEEAKIKEAKDTPTIQVLDRASPPDRKYRPKRAIIVVFYTFFGVVLSAFYLVFKESIVSFYRNNLQ